MLTGKERAKIKGRLQTEKPKLYIGKNGITENLVKQADDILNKDEIIKVRVQTNISEEKKDFMNELIDRLGAEYVMDLGNVFGLYREKEDK